MARFPRILTAGLLAIALTGWASPAAAKKKNDKKADAERTGVVAGTVFQHSGFSLPGARVTVAPAPEDASEGSKIKAQQAVTDSRGEFAVRVPAESMRYNVTVEAEGWQPAEKMVQVEWDQRVEVFFRLKPAPGKGTK